MTILLMDNGRTNFVGFAFIGKKLLWKGNLFEMVSWYREEEEMVTIYMESV